MILFAGTRIVFEYKRALKFRFGKYIKVLEPGLRWIVPVVETIQAIVIRVITINIFSQEVMIRDNLPCRRDRQKYKSYRRNRNRAMGHHHYS